MSLTDRLTNEVEQILDSIEVIRTALQNTLAIAPEESILKNSKTNQQNKALTVITSIETGFIAKLKGVGQQGMRDFINKSISSNTYHEAIMQLQSKLIQNESVLQASGQVSDLMLVRLKTHIQHCMDILETQNDTSTKGLLKAQKNKGNKTPFKEFYFTYSGRINQKKFVVGIFITYILLIIPNIIFGFIAGALSMETALGSPGSLWYYGFAILVFFGSAGAFGWAHFCLITKRAHDLKLPGILPILFLLLGFVLSFFYSFSVFLFSYGILVVSFSLIPSQTRKN